MRKALIVGINDYASAPLKGCVNDAQRMYNILSKHSDTSPNFSCKLLTSDNTRITKAKLSEEVKDLFSYDSDIALLYFSGHGYANDIGGFLVTQDAKKGDIGIPLNEIVRRANNSDIREIIIILDCCHSGEVGNDDSQKVSLNKGISILASSLENQPSIERGNTGVFTSIICDALEGAAADILGNITVASIYNYADQLLSPWDQRPIFKTYVSKMISLRKCEPRIDLDILRNLLQYFPNPNYQFPLAPSYEPTAEPRDEDKEAIFSQLQKLVSIDIVEPVGDAHMYFAAINEGFAN